MRGHRQQGFFATLRRDGVLFAVLATMIMALHALQPMVAAQAADSASLHAVLCLPSNTDQQSGAGDEPRHGDCNACVAGPCSGFARLAPASEGGDAAAYPEVEYAVWAPLPQMSRVPVRRPGDPPPTMRAPPLSA